MRSVYSQQVCTAQELFVELLAAKFKMDRLEFRHKFAKLDKIRKVLDTLRDAWDPNLEPGTGIGQGVAVWLEHKQVTGCLVKLDCRPETVNRQVRQAITGPRVIEAVYATVPGKVVVNPLGMEAQIQGGFLDGMSYALTANLHLVDGHFLEASWDNYAYARQWNVPRKKIQVHILPPDPNEKPAGQGETAVPCSRAATACAYAHAMGGAPPSFWPVAHDKPLHFKPYPTVPPLPTY
jgi:isoquinoline 1-oxidoreductase beta subunit